MEEFILKIGEFLDLAETKAVFIAMALDFVLRMFKSKKPLSVLYLVSGFLSQASKYLVLFAGLVEKSAKFLDKVLPQRLENK